MFSVCPAGALTKNLFRINLGNTNRLGIAAPLVFLVGVILTQIKLLDQTTTGNESVFDYSIFLLLTTVFGQIWGVRVTGVVELPRA